MLARHQCGLASDLIQRFYNEDSQTWTVNNTLLRQLDDDLQRVIECAIQDDVILLRTNDTIQPSTTMNISLPLTLRGESGATVNCPQQRSLLISRASNVRIEDLVISGCNGTSSIIVLHPSCERGSMQNTTILNNVTFVRNAIFEDAHIIEANTSCLELELIGVVLSRNICIGTHCVSLGNRTTMRDLHLLRNQGSDDASLDSSIFSTFEGAETIVTNVNSRRNMIRSFHVHESILTIRDSLFIGNSRNQSSMTRDNSIGGGVLFSNHSSISISNTTLEHNHALNGGGVFAWSSNITISDCVFRENDAGEGDGGALYGHYNSSFDVSSSMFTRNHAYIGAGLYSNYTLRVNIVNVNLSENACNQSCGISVQNGVARIRSCQFLENAALQGGGALGAIDTTLTLRNSSFIGNNAFFGGACVFQDDCTVHGSSLLFESNIAYEADAGGIELSLNGRMRIRDSEFRDNFGVRDAGAIFALRECETVLRRVVFLNNTASRNSGAIQIWTGNFSGSDLTFRRNRASTYGAAIRVFRSNNVSISRSLFADNNAASSGAIECDSAPFVYLQQCSFVENSAHESGGAIRALASNVNILSSLFRANTSPFGGSVALLNRCSSTIQNSRFENNTATDGGGAISITFFSSLSLSNSSFLGNSGRSGGVLTAINDSNILISQVDFVENYASGVGCLLLSGPGIGVITNSTFSSNAAPLGIGAIHVDFGFELSISNSTFEDNNGGIHGGAVAIFRYSTLNLNTVNFDRNEASWGGALYMVEFCTIGTNNCSFSNNSAMNSGGAIHVTNSSTISLIASTFSGNKATNGGGLRVSNNSTAILQSNIFTRNNATAGGAISIGSSNMLLLSIFMDSNSAASGGSLAISSSSIEMVNSTIRRCSARTIGGAFVILQTNMTMERITLESNEALGDGGAIVASLSSHVNASNIEVLSNSAGNSGGGIVVAHESSLLCYSCLFINNRALTRAGLIAFSNNSISIVAQLQNSHFENNYATSYGGGIEFEASQNRSMSCIALGRTCGHIILLNTSFVNNYATHSGAIFLTFDPVRVLTSCEYQGRRNIDFLNERDFNNLEVVDPRELCLSWRNNRISSNAYGGLVATYGEEVVLNMSSSEGVRLVGSRESGYVLENVRSGNQIPDINIIILDGYGQGPAPTLPHNFTAQWSSSDGFFNGAYVTIINAGFGTFSRVIGLATPGNYTLEFSFANEALEPFNVEVIVRDCLIDEEITSDGLTCQECDAFSYNFNPLVVGGCTECPSGATCRERFIVPENNHWHKSPCHDTVQECLVEEACSYKNRHEALTIFTQNWTDCNTNETTLGSYNDVLCNEGYKGPLCGSCNTSFGLSSRFLCLKCASTFLSLLTIFAITIYLLGASYVTINGSLSSKRAPQTSRRTLRRSQPTPQGSQPTSSQSSNEEPEVVVEMANVEVASHVSPHSSQNRHDSITSRLQTPPPTQQESEYELTRWKRSEIIKTIATAATISVQWTRGLLVLFKASEYVGGVTTAAVSGPVDCFTSTSSAIERAIWRMLVSLFVRGIVLSILFSAWGINAYRRKKGWSYFWRRAILIVIAVTYVSYLGLTEMGVRAFYCVDVYDSSSPSIDSKEAFWAGDTAIKCYGKDHGRIIAIGTVVLSVISVLFPLTSVAVLSFNKKDFKRRDGWIFATTGFLYRAFKERCFFWETLVMLRKACLSVIVVFSYPLGGDIQGLLISLLLFFSLYIHFTMKPYREEFKLLNHLEALSLFVSGITFNLALFFVDGRCSDAVRTLLAVIIIVGNLSFIVFLLVVLFYSTFLYWKATLAWENQHVPDDPSCCQVIMIYIASRPIFRCCAPKKKT